MWTTSCFPLWWCACVCLARPLAYHVQPASGHHASLEQSSAQDISAVQQSTRTAETCIQSTKSCVCCVFRIIGNSNKLTEKHPPRSRHSFVLTTADYATTPGVQRSCEQHQHARKHSVCGAYRYVVYLAAAHAAPPVLLQQTVPTTPSLFFFFSSPFFFLFSSSKER